MIPVSLESQCLSTGTYCIQPLLPLTSAIPCLFIPAFSYHFITLSIPLDIFFFFPLFGLNYPEQGKEKSKTFEECHVIHIFNMCKTTEHNITGNSYRRERDDSLNFHIL